MAAIFKVKLEDNYTDKAKKITSATSQMESAMSKVSKTASRTKSALKSALSGTHRVKISEVGSRETRAKIYKLNNDLKSITGKPLNFSITAKTGKIDYVKNQFSKMKSGVDSISNAFNNKLDKGFNKFSKFSSSMSAFRQAKKEAKQLSKEMSALTGKKHKIRVDMENPIKGVMSKMKSGLSAGFSKLNPRNWFGGGGGDPAGAAPGGGGGLVGSIVKGSLITGAIQKGFSVLKGGFDATLGAGMARLENIQASKAKLRGFGHDDKTVNTISQNAMAAVKGTAYGFGDAMTASANAVAAGVKPGKDLEKHLGIIANSAAATGADFNEMGSIFNKVKTTGYLQGDEAMQIMDRGIALLPALAKTMNTSVDEVRKKMSKGEVSFEDFSAAMEDATGTVASEMSNTFSGAKDNFKAALGRVGAGLLGGSDNEGGVFAMLTPMIKGLTSALGPLEDMAGKLGDKFGDLATGAIDKVKSGFGKVSEFFQPAMEKFKEGFTTVSEKLGQVIDPLKEKLSSAFEGLKEAFSPLIGAISGLFGNVVEGNFSIFTTMIDLAAQGLSFLADAIMIATPVIQSIAEWISANIIPAMSEVVSWVSGTLIPAISDVVSTIMGVLIPIFQTVADFIGSYVVPAFEIIASTILSVAEPVFHAIASAVEWATGKFNDLVGAVGSAVDALLSVPGKIAGMVKDAASGLWDTVTGWIPGNATGTSYFGGGMTRVNERGEEMIQLARGDKIYPAGKTDRIIEKQINNKNQSRETKNITISPTININGANKNGEDIAKEVNRQLKRLAVNI